MEEKEPYLQFNFKEGTFSSAFLSDAPYGCFDDHDLLQEHLLVSVTPQMETWCN